MSEPETVIEEIKNKLSELQRELRRMKEHENYQKRYQTRRNNKIFRLIDYWVSFGMQTHEAVELIASDLDRNPDDLAFIYARYNRKQKAIKKYAQRFMIKTLQRKNFKMCQIAKILDLSVRTVAYRASEEIPDFDNV